MYSGIKDLPKQNMLTLFHLDRLLPCSMAMSGLVFFMIGCATPKTAVDYIDGTEVMYAPVMAATADDAHHEKFNVAVQLFLPGADLDKLEVEGAGVITTDESGTPNINHKAVDPKIRRLETHFFPIALKNSLDKSSQWGQTFVSPGEVQSADVYVRANILASDGHSIALLIYAVDSTGRVWFNETIEYKTQELDYQSANWPERDPYDAVFNHINNKLVEVRNSLTADEQRKIRLVSEMRFASDLAPDAFENYLARDAKNRLYVQRFPAESDPNYQIIQQLQGTELDMLSHIEEYYNDLYQGVYDPYSTWREQFRQLSIEMEQYRVDAQNQKTSSILAGVLFVAVAGGSDSYQSVNSYGVAQSAALLVGGIQLSAAMYEAAKEKIEIANLKAKELSEISVAAGEGMQPKVIELEGRTYQLTGDVEDRFRQIRDIIRKRYLLETGQEDLVPDDSAGAL